MKALILDLDGAHDRINQRLVIEDADADAHTGNEGFRAPQLVHVNRLHPSTKVSPGTVGAWLRHARG
jgi:hypothetical protein